MLACRFVKFAIHLELTAIYDKLSLMQKHVFMKKTALGPDVGMFSITSASKAWTHIQCITFSFPEADHDAATKKSPVCHRHKLVLHTIRGFLQLADVVMAQ